MNVLIELIWIVLKTAIVLGLWFIGLCLLGYVLMLLWFAITATNIPMIVSCMVLVGAMVYGVYKMFNGAFKRLEE